jgi:membrane protein
MLGTVRGAWARFRAQDGPFLAAGLSFAFLVCLIPLLLLGVSLAGFVLSREQAAQEVVALLARQFPVYRAEFQRALLRVVQTRGASGVVGTVVLILFSTWLFGAARLVMHRMLGIRRARPLMRSVVGDAGLVVLLILLLFGTGAVTWGAEGLRALLVPHWSGPSVRLLTVALGTSTSGVMLYLGFRYVPTRRVRPGAALGAALVTTVLWEVAKQGFRWYVRRLALYDQIYGPLGVLAAFAMFVYYSALVFVFGAAWAASAEARRR